MRVGEFINILSYIILEHILNLNFEHLSTEALSGLYLNISHVIFVFLNTGIIYLLSPTMQVVINICQIETNKKKHCH